MLNHVLSVERQVTSKIFNECIDHFDKTLKIVKTSLATKASRLFLHKGHRPCLRIAKVWKHEKTVFQVSTELSWDIKMYG